MKEASYDTVLGRVNGYRRGITTGTCAAAAAKAAAGLVTGEAASDSVLVTLPESRKPYSGKSILVPLDFSSISDGIGEAGVIKDAGDDDDITNNTVIIARAKRIQEPEIRVTGGEGVGLVTRAGLRVPRGGRAINPTPMAMITRECSDYLDGNTGLEIEIIVPEGRRLGVKTWNPRIGIEEGISILGNSGVVEPRSSKAWMASLAMLIKASADSGQRSMIVVPGFVGEAFLYKNRQIRENFGVAVGDYVGFAFRQLNHWGFKEMIFAAHVSKTAKVAAGLFHTHAKYGDARLEMIAAAAAAAGAPGELAGRLLELKLAEESIPLIQNSGYDEAFYIIAQRAAERLRGSVSEGRTVGCVVLDMQGNPLGAYPRDLMGDEEWERFR